ncbi:hypothetical protein [Actinomyces sp. ZJ308]|uniref:hypothetical protein n=1 Tax=Actinomyces sp. ZJ308 TaxID=2708342 RepID=UPI001422F57F|nr:hypothetical protein [Actinomyces sp. ZJ308]
MRTTKIFPSSRLLSIFAVILVCSILQGCVPHRMQQSTPTPVPTVLSSGESDWVCPGVPQSAARPIVGDRFDWNEINSDDNEGELRGCYIWKIPKKNGGSYLSVMWGESTRLKKATDYSFDENSDVFDPTEVDYGIEGVDGVGALVEPHSGNVRAAWKCGSFKRGIIVKILYDSQEEYPRNLGEDATNMVKLIRPWACGEVALPGADVATSSGAATTGGY